MYNLNRIKLSDLARNDDNKKLDLVVELEYLGNLDVESKYLQHSIIKWLIAQVKLLETEKRIKPVLLEVNVRKNNLNVYRKDTNNQLNYDSNFIKFSLNDNFIETNNINNNKMMVQEPILNHKLSDIFKLTTLANNPLCFGYFYRKNNTSFNYYTLHVFYSNKANLCQVLYDFQMQALKLHENLLYEKLFDFKLVTKLVITQEELNIPNFIEICLDKANTTKNDIKTLFNSLNKNPKTKNEKFLNLLSDKRVLLKFGPNRLYLQESDKEPLEQEYKNVVYLNNSITNENFFCLAYSDHSNKDIKNNSKNNFVNALILYSNNVETIDNVIREYAINVSSELNVIELNNQLKLNESSKSCLDDNLNSSFKLEQHTCPNCPMQQFVELCEYLNKYENQNDLIYDILIDKLNYNLNTNDQNYIYDYLNKNSYFGLGNNKDKLVNDLTNENSSLEETNQLLVSLIHTLCKNKQNEHLIDYLNEKKNRFTSSKFSLIERSTTTESNSFVSAKQSKSFHSNLVNINHNTNNKKIKSKIHRSNTLDSFVGLDKLPENFISSTRSSLQFNKNSFSNQIRFLNFKKLLNENKVNDNYQIEDEEFDSTNHNSNLNENEKKYSIKRHIFNKIVGAPYVNGGNSDSTSNNESEKFKFKRFKSSYEIKQFWKKIISEQIILIKMEKENRKMSIKASYANANKLKTLRSNLNYIEITPCLKEVDKIWETWLLIEENDLDARPDFDTIIKTVFKGVPQNKREKVWFWLMKQFKLRNNSRNKENLSMPIDIKYKELLNHSTIHQHAILLDLGRTFPNHVNFSKKFGPGQLALFNVLKAYSILDSEVGYCQGLSFIVGILLIHVNNDEEKTFELLKFLLIDLNFREQYKPDMIQLQKHMYQFTRLLYDNCNDIFNHFENNEVSSSLYAAPWFLTLFSSQFQIGFVARVFDFLFTEGPEVLFKLSLAILSIHKPLLHSCDSFEAIVNHIKTTIPEMSLIETELIINKAFGYDHIKNDLYKYEIEFNLLNEDFTIAQNYLSKSNSRNLKKNYSSLSLPKQNDETVNMLESENNKLKNEVKDLKEKLQLLQLQIHNQDDHFYKLHHENKQLKCKVETLEFERNGILKKVKDQEKIINSIMH